MTNKFSFAALLLSVAFVATRAAQAEEPNQLTAAEKKGGWILLFDGKTTEGWRGYKKDKAPKGWKIEDGSMKRVGGGGDIMTNDKFDHFELSLEWNLPKGGNSGIIYRVAETKGPSYVTGPEIQVMGDMAVGNKHSAGACYALYAPTKKALKPNGHWNSVRLIIRPDNRTEHWMNGEKICEYTIGGDDWNSRVAKSKFARMPMFGKVAKGHLCLQDHGNEVWYRNIKIRHLKDK